MNQRNSYLKNLKGIRASYEGMIYLLEHGEVESSQAVAERVIDRLTGVFESLKDETRENFHRAFVQKYQSFKEDKENQAAIFKNKIEYEEFAVRIESVIDFLTDYVKKHFPRNWNWRAFACTKEGKIRPYVWAVLLITLLIPVRYIWCSYQVSRHSLFGEYYSDLNFKQLFETRQDSEIDFDWGYGSPFWEFQKDYFTVRWTGYLNVEKSGDYTFTTITDDGVRVWINDNLIIDDWNSHFAVSNTGTISLEKGAVPVKIEYFEENLTAVAKLYWQGPQHTKPVIISGDDFLTEKAL